MTTLRKGETRVFRLCDNDGYFLGKKHGEIFITNWTVDYNKISSIIEDIDHHASDTWSIACLKDYGFKVTVRFLDKEDADWFENTKWGENCERKLLLI
jgi:hypothetical protein